MNSRAEQYVRSLIGFKEKHQLILTKLYALKARLVDAPTSPHLVDVSLAKVRYTVDRKFPILVDLSQSSGFSSLMDAAGDILSAYDPLVRVMREVSLYMSSMLAVLKSPYIFNIDLAFDRPALYAWIEAFSAYVKVMLFLDKFPEAQPMILLFFAAKSVAGSLKQANASASDFAWFKKAVGNVRRHLIDEFTPLQGTLLHLVNEVKDVVCFAYDLNNLRELFDLSNTDIELSGYRLTVLGRKPCHFELCHVPRYAEFIILSVLACPALFFDEEVLDLLQSVTEHVFIVALFRDITINTHKELETIFASYPGETDTAVKVPKHFKAAAQLKQLSRQSVSKAGRHQAIRRRLLVHFLQDNVNLVKLLPGVVGVKAPLLSVACAWLNEEVSLFCQHFPPFACRRDTRSFLDAELYQVDDLGSALKTLHDAVALVSASGAVIAAFHRDQLRDLDLPPLRQYLATLGAGDAANTAAAVPLPTLRAAEQLLQGLEQWAAAPPPPPTTATSSGGDAALTDDGGGGEGGGEGGGAVTAEAVQRLLLDVVHAVAYRGSLEQLPAVGSGTAAAVAASATNARGSVLAASASGMRSSVTGAPIMSLAAAQLAAIPPVAAVPEAADALLRAHDAFAFAASLAGVVYLADPFRVGWFRDVLRTCFLRSLSPPEAPDGDRAAAAAAAGGAQQPPQPAPRVASTATAQTPFLAHFHPLESVLLNVHPAVVEEVVPLGRQAAAAAQEMAAALVDAVLRLFKRLWAQYAQLDLQVHPNELIRRLDAMAQQQRLFQTGSGVFAGLPPTEAPQSAASLGLLPGFESELWAEESLTALVATQKKLAQLLHAVRLKPVVRVFDKELRLRALVRQRLHGVFVEKSGALRRQVADVVTLAAALAEAARLGEPTATTHHQARFSVLVWRFNVGSRLLQRCVESLGDEAGDLARRGCYVGDVLREVRRREVFGFDLRDDVETALWREAQDAAVSDLDERSVAPGGGGGGAATFAPQSELYVAMGIPVPLDHRLPEDCLSEALCDWFDILVTQALAAPAGPWVYAPATQNFVHFARWRHLQQLARYQQQVAAAGAAAAPPAIDTAAYFPPGDVLVEALLQPDELTALVSFVGVYGVRLLEARLLTIVHAQVKLVLQLLERNRAHVEVLAKDYCFSVTAAQAMDGLEAFVAALRTIGVALTVRQMLLGAVARVSQAAAPDLHAYLATLHASLDAHCHPLAATTSRIALYSLTHSLGLVATPTATAPAAAVGSSAEPDRLTVQSPQQAMGYDFSLFEALITSGFTAADAQTLQLLPVFAAALMAHRVFGASPAAGGLKYHPEHRVFERNEHLLPRALVALTNFALNLAEHLKQPVHVPGLSAAPAPHASLAMLVSGEAAHDDGPASEEEMLALANATVLRAAAAPRGVDKVELRTHKQWIRFQAFRAYLRFGCQVLLTRRERENPMTFVDVPYAALWMLQRHFVEEAAPWLTMQQLQAFVPYDFIHHMALDLSLGKATAKDVIHAFNALPLAAHDVALQPTSQRQEPGGEDGDFDDRRETEAFAAVDL